MADSKISALTALAEAPAAGDLLVLVDVSDTTMAVSGTDKKITFTNLTGTFLSTTGATTGATSQAQTFTGGIKSPSIQAISDSTTHGWKNAAGAYVLTVNTTDSRASVTGGSSSVASLGSDLVTNGAFATDATGWTLGANWTHGSGKVSHAAGSVETLSQSFTVVAATTYIVTFTVTDWTVGSVTVSIGGTSAAALSANAAGYQVSLTTVGTGELTFTPTTDFNGSIDDVSVKLLTPSVETFFLVDSDGTVGMRLRAGKTNIVIGQDAGRSLTSGTYNSTVGYRAGYSLTTGSYNNAFGYLAAYNLTTGLSNYAFGREAAYNLTSGNHNNAFGYQSAYSLSTGSYNNVFGYLAAYSLSTGSYNNAFGYLAAYSLSTGSYNNAFGREAAYSLSTGGYNGAFGYRAAYNLSTGSYNNAFGREAASSLTTGSGNNIFGYRAGDNITTGNYNIVIGYDVDAPSATADSQLVIGAYLRGESGKLSVGQPSVTPTAVLHVAASTTTRASVCVVAGTAPTTPVAGDIWNDGALSFYNADATTNAIVNHLRLSRDSTGTAAAGLGLGILAELESTTTSRQSAGRLTWEWATATHASRAAKGKLTAYYTSTEREVITWVADSSSARVGIMQASPYTTLDVAGGVRISSFLTPSAGAGLELGYDGGNNRATITAYDRDASAYKTFVQNGLDYQFYISGSEKVRIDTGGNVGIGVSSPQSLIHGHDGSGGFLFVNRASVGGTLVTVIPDAAGDVTEKIFFVGWCTNSAPFSADVAPTTLAVSSSTTKTDGTNTLTIAVTASGAFTLQATGGAATWNVNLWVFWR